MSQANYDKRLMEEVRNLRRSKDLKQDTIALALNIDRTTYSRIERGERPFTVSQLRSMCNALGVSLHKLIKIVESNYKN